MKTLKRIQRATVLLLAMGLSAAVNAAPILNALSIVIDGSGSISSSNFNTQKNAYAVVLNDLVPTNGSVILNVVQFSTAGQTRIEQTAIRVNDAGDLLTVIGAINTMTQINGSTAIGEGIQVGYTDLDAYIAGIAASEFDTDFRKLIDVSTDGGENQGTDPAGMTANAVDTLGYDAVNCLGIGSNISFLCGWNDGYGDDYQANTFAEVEAALRLKIAAEVNPAPVPATIWLIGLGLLGLHRFARRA